MFANTRKCILITSSIRLILFFRFYKNLRYNYSFPWASHCVIPCIDSSTTVKLIFNHLNSLAFPLLQGNYGCHTFLHIPLVICGVMCFLHEEGCIHVFRNHKFQETCTLLFIAYLFLYKEIQPIIIHHNTIWGKLLYVIVCNVKHYYNYSIDNIWIQMLWIKFKQTKLSKQKSYSVFKKF